MATLEVQDETAPAQRSAMLKRLESRIEQLEYEISNRVAAFRSQALPAQLFAAVARAIPPGAALVDSRPTGRTTSRLEGARRRAISHTP
jgi:hypothetical protein